MKQYEAVMLVMEENNGYATLGYLYENVLKVPNVVWKTKTPFASIRRIVQDKRFFFKVKPGLWALNSYRDKLPKEIQMMIKEERTGKGNFTHYYYQGLLLQIGKIKGYETYVPPQDKNRIFLSDTLKDYSDLDSIYNFTYGDVIHKVKSIDVFWFNERKFPASVFEIEHSTDFKNSLLKFLELQDFKTKMYIVAPKERYNEFLSKREFTGFKEIKDNVKFLSYEKLSYWHTKSYELALIEKSIR